ncbi:RNA polymerase sigma factor [Aminipila sp.]|uniref:RNA polymerase sigma factor n=1 Tax=Aminipila sp. TaxID=2060095 RepID=UPI00289790F6|nr:RNA polymerase sigma factor [Aminipila sp.]
MNQCVRDKNFFLENIAVHEVDVYSYLVSITDEPQVSEDLLQNTMEKAWGNIGQLREQSKARSWLFSIAKNEVNQYYRYHENIYSYIEDMDGDNVFQLNYTRERADVLESLVRNFDMSAMREALKRLDGKYRRLIVMHYFQGMNQKEIAEILNQNHSTVRVNLVRALKKVRKIREQIERGELDVNIK